MRIFVTILGLLVCTSSWAGIGVVSETKGTACEITRGKTKLTGVKGADIESMDTYTTGSCVSNITFRDDTKVRVTENSRLFIDDFVFDPKQSDAGKLAMKVGMGTVRYASGQIAKTNPQQVSVKTPTATIAVRGTDFTMTVDETGQSLVILVPSCPLGEEKIYEWEENKCKVGKIEVTTMAGTVVLDQAFHATFVASATLRPSTPTVINTLEGNIGSHLIIVRPHEIKQAVKEIHDKHRPEGLESGSDDAHNKRQRHPGDMEQARMLANSAAAAKAGCNSSSSVCVIWEKPELPDIQSKGAGTAFRNTETEHYAEVKTQGHSSNTSIAITHNDMPASMIIGDGNFGGNSVSIIQNYGISKKR